MGGVYTIYAYFNSAEIQSILNSVVMLVGSGGVDGDYLSIIRVAAILGMFMAVTYGFVKARGEDAAHYLIMVAIFYSTLFVPRVTVTIEEHGGTGGGAPIVVDNVPLGLAFFASTTSHIGYWLTEKTETFFSLPDTSLKLSQHGLMGGPRALRLAQSAAMPDPVLAQDMINFMRDCINPELVLSPASVNGLLSSTNIWADFTTLNLINPGRMVTLSGGSGAEGCDTAYTTTIGTRLAPAAASESSRIAQLLSPSATPVAANTILGSMLPAAEGIIMTASASAADAIRQRMMINLLNDTSQNMAQIMNDPSAAQAALGTAIATSSANSAYTVLAKLAQETLPLIRNAIELVVLGIFPIVLILIIIAGSRGGTVLRSYVMAMLWIQMWAPLYAIVNYVGTMAAAKSMKASLAGIDGISVVNAAQLMNTTISAEAIAGMLSISVPMIALAIIKGGEAAMTGITGSIMQPANQAATKTGEHVGSGNVSMGNTSWGSHTAYNATANQSREGFGYSDINRGDVTTPRGGYTVDGRNGAIGNLRADMGNLGVSGETGKSVAAAKVDASGLQAAGVTTTETGLSTTIRGGYTESQAATATAKIGKALDKAFGTKADWGTGTRAAEVTGNSDTVRSSQGSGNTEAIYTDSKLAVGAQVGKSFQNPVSNAAQQTQTTAAKNMLEGVPNQAAGQQPVTAGNGAGATPVQPAAVQQGGSNVQPATVQQGGHGNVPPAAVQQGGNGNVQPAAVQQGGSGNVPPAAVQQGGKGTPQASVPQGQMPKTPEGNVQRSAERAAQVLAKAPDSAGFSVGGSVGGGARTAENKDYKTERGGGSENKDQIEKNVGKAIAAIQELKGRTSNAGERAAMDDFMGQLAKSTDSTYGTKTSSSLTQNASSTNQRTSTNTAGASVSQSPMVAEEAIKLAGGSVVQAIDRMATDGNFRQQVADNVAARLSGQAVPNGAPVTAADGKTQIGAPTPVAQGKADNDRKVQAARPANDAAATNAGHAGMKKAANKRQEIGGPATTAMPSLAPAVKAFGDIAGRAENQIATSANAGAIKGGINRATDAMFADAGGMGRLLSTSFLGGLIGDSRSPEQMKQGLQYLAANDPEANKRLLQMGTNGRANEDDIKFLNSRAQVVQQQKTGGDRGVLDALSGGA